MKKIIFITLLLVVLGGAVFVGMRYYYPFGEGVKSGQLNYVVKKGIIFKTYEGKLIQAGISSKKGAVQSNQFEFSLTNKEIAEKLMISGGKNVQLHYVEYFGALPWRGFSCYIVDSIISISEPVEINNQIVSAQ